MKKVITVIIVVIAWTVGGILLRKYSIIGGENSKVSKDVEKKPIVSDKETKNEEKPKANKLDEKDKSKEDKLDEKDKSKEDTESEIPYQVPTSIEVMKEHYDLNNEMVIELNKKVKALDKLVEKSMNEAALEGDVTREEIILRVHHMKRVGDLSMELMVAYEEKEGVSFSLEEAECLMIAAYTHDICKFAKGNHAKLGANYILDNMSSAIGFTERQIENISLLIKYHSNPLSPDDKKELAELVVLEELLQDADMFDKIINKGASDKNNIDALYFESSKELLKSKYNQST